MAVVNAVVRTHWQGTTGGPGLTQLHMQGITDPHTWDAAAAQVAVDAVRAFWDAVKGIIPNEVTLTVDPVVDVYNILDGELVGSYSAATPPVNVLGTATGSFSMASGVKLNLNTGVIRNGRRVRGSIFIVPADGTAFTVTGVVSAGTRATINTAANTLRTTLAGSNKELIVYSRPKTSPVFVGGAASPVNGAEAAEKGAILRGRRD